MRLKLTGQIKERPLIRFSGNVTFEAAVVKKTNIIWTQKMKKSISEYYSDITEGQKHLNLSNNQIIFS